MSQRMVRVAGFEFEREHNPLIHLPVMSSTGTGHSPECHGHDPTGHVPESASGEEQDG